MKLPWSKTKKPPEPQELGDRLTAVCQAQQLRYQIQADGRSILFYNIDEQLIKIVAEETLRLSAETAIRELS